MKMARAFFANYLDIVIHVYATLVFAGGYYKNVLKVQRVDVFNSSLCSCKVVYIMGKWLADGYGIIFRR